MKKIFSIAMAVCVIFAMIGCDDGSTGSSDSTSWTVKYSANGWTGGGLPAAAKVKKGESLGATIVLPLDDTATQAFLGWSLTSGQNGERVIASYTPKSNITLYALWLRIVEVGNSVTITYNANGWLGTGVPTSAPTAKNSGERIGAENIPDISDGATSGQVFYGWAITSGQTGNRLTATYTLRGNVTLYVLWRTPITLNFDYNYTNAPPNPASVTVGKDIPIGNVLPVVVDTDHPVEGQDKTRPGFLFDGWFTEPTGGRLVSSSFIFTENATLYGQWTVEPNWAFLEMDLSMMPLTQGTQDGWGNPSDANFVSYDSNGALNWTFNGNDRRGIILFSTGQREVLKRIDEFRLIIDGETEPADSTIPFRFFIGNMDVTADWNGTAAITAGEFSTQTNNTVQFNGNKMKVEGNSDPPRPEEPRIQAYILQQRAGGTVKVIIRSIKLRYDKDIGGEAPTAKPIKISYDRNFDGAPIGPNPAILSEGDQIGNYYYRKTLPEVTQNLYEFKGWYTDKTAGTKVEPTTTFNTSTTIYARWEKLPEMTISFNLNYTTSETPPASVLVPKGYPITDDKLPKVTREAYFFRGWNKVQGGGDNTAVTGTTTFSDNATLYAQWESVGSLKYTVTFNDGYQTGDTAVVKTVELTPFGKVDAAMPSTPARADTDWHFTGWFTAKRGGTEFTANSVVEGNITIYAQWEYNGALTVPWQDKVYMYNSAVPVYGFDIGSDTFGSYTRIKVSLKYDTDSPVKTGRLRAWGNYSYSAFTWDTPNTRPSMEDSTPGGKLLNTNTLATFTTEWQEYVIELNNRDTLNTAATIKAATGVILLGFGPIPPSGTNANKIYYVKDISLENADGTKKVSALHPLDPKLWTGKGETAFVTSSSVSTNYVVREWSKQ